MISSEEMQRRREHVKAAIANSRLEGMRIGPEAQDILDAYIRGEIEAAELVTAGQLISDKMAENKQ